ncbi:KPN_02809 family neutral zinc metallopeptidase [Flavobacterium subsaxonicum]|uniref:Metalloprotease n=1 Tax=Flavobacterium subsaxonicum WB 4.1-42 = DSM 21790 TaxID=1121898 RepID=A0A0A2MTG1_9FLAO|nr:neutral zinc metallopeptidase [Flavobacterium subsaxonicum]KGO94738.1 metalloprotease [Flavobacterium subsaxonicum WB 4.1-42 = DSM 21790]
MKWLGRRQSDNMEDRRGVSGGQVAVGGGIIGVIILVINMFMGGDNSAVLNTIQDQLQNGQTEQAPVELSARDKEMGEFVATVLADTEDVWTKIFQENGMTYEKPKLVLFRDGVQTACGGASSASGPFYCPEDRKVYMDLAFFDELQSRFGAKGGDFAIAYVIAHEIGHHVQTLMGTSAKMRQAQQQTNEAGANKLSVALELQADFYAGLWAHYNQEMNNVLEDGDIEEALSAANAVGDDAIQKKTQGSVVPDSFTHGSSQQRMYWFKKGFESGDIKQGDTFAEIQ